MSRNGSGTYTLPAGNPVVTGTTIASTWANNTMNDLAAALTDSVAADGQTAMTGNLNLNSNKIVNVADPTLAQDAATKNYSDTTYLAKASNLSDVANATTSRTNISAAKSGANSDITSLTGLTTPLSQAQGGTGTSTGYYGFKNRIINGAMVIDQRNAGASVNPTDGQYGIDRWILFTSQASKYTAQQNAGAVTPPAGFTNYLGITSSSAYSITSSDYFIVEQKIEGFNVADLNWGTANAKTVTLSFQVYSSLTGTFGGSVQNSAGNRSYPFTYTISAANTWEQKSVTIAGDTSGTWVTNNGVGIRLQFGLGVGSTISGTAGAWAAAGYASATGAVSVVGTNGATFYITGVQLEVGSTATSFDYRPYGTELLLCQRYFVKDLQNASSATFLIGVVDASTSADRCGMRFPVTMRTSPTAAVGGTANPRIYDGSAPTVTSIISNSSSSFGASLSLGASAGGLTVGRAAIIIDNNASFITYSAEL